MAISPEQCRAARALLGWSQDELSRAGSVAKATIANFEAGKRSPYGRTLDDLVSALERAGVQFIAENGGGPGVRLRKAGKGTSSDGAMEVGDEVAYREERGADLEHLGKIGRLIDPGHTPPDPTRVCVEFDGDGGTWVSKGTLVLVRKGKRPDDHPKPVGPATDAVNAMDAAITKDRAGRAPSKRLASVKETGEEIPQEEWERFEAAEKKPRKD